VSEVDSAQPHVVPAETEGLWFLGTYERIKLEGRQTGGRLGVFESVLPHGAAPPLHSHPQDETFYVLDGELTVWLVDPELAAATASDGGPPPWVEKLGRRCGVGAMMFAPGGTAHTFRVETGTARVLVISTPGGIEELVLGLGEPAQWPWLQPPPDGPRVAPERIAAVERALGMVRHGPPPPPAAD
jgi:hypothetical protein